MDYSSFIQSCEQCVTKSNIAQIPSSEGYKKLKSISQGNVKTIRKKIIFFRKKIFLDHFINAKPLFPNLLYCNTLLDSIRIDDALPSRIVDDIDWNHILLYLSEIKDTCSLMKSDSYHEELHNKDIEFSKSCKRLSDIDIHFLEKDDEIFIGENSIPEINKRIDNLCNEIGGVNILRYSFKLLASNYDNKMNRYHIYRKLSMGMQMTQPSIPWGYLISLGYKHLDVNGHGETTKNYQTLLNLLKDLIATYEVQQYTPVETMFVEPSDLLKFIINESLYDSLVCTQQINYDYCKRILSFICSLEKYHHHESYGFKLKKIFAVCIALIDLAETNSIKPLSIEELSSEFKLSISKTKQILNEILVNKSPNYSLTFPPSSTNVDHNFNPLTKSGDLFYLAPKPFTSISVLNCVLNTIISPSGVRNNDNDAKLGCDVESYAKEVLNEKEIRFCHGDFVSKNGKIVGESDIFIETTDSIILMEVKKKGLTRLAMSGIDYSILKDLGDSFIHAQSQCFKAECVLVTDGEITIKNEVTTSTIEHKNRRILKVAVTLNDFGSFQDKMNIRSILSNAVRMEFAGKTEDINKKLKGWSVHLSEMVEYLKIKQKLGFEDREPFHDVHFISIPQLMMFVDDSDSNDELASIFKRFSGLTFSTKDIYKEYAEMKRLHASK